MSCDENMEIERRIAEAESDIAALFASDYKEYVKDPAIVASILYSAIAGREIRHVGLRFSS
jgi:hypothetical protein